MSTTMDWPVTRHCPRPCAPGTKWLFLFGYTHMHTCTHTCTHMHTHAHTCTHMHTHAHTSRRKSSGCSWFFLFGPRPKSLGFRLGFMG